MLRQNPIQKKRIELNLKPRLLKPKAGASEPVVPEPSVASTPSISAEPPPPIKRDFEQAIAPVSSSTHLEPPKNYEEKLEYYRVPQILSALLVGSDPQVLPMLRAGLEKSQELKDEIYQEIFKGAIAANESPADIAQAVRDYHRAFDLLEKRREKSDGFLHSLVWNLFARSSDNEDVANLLDRARSELRNITPQNNIDIRIRRVRDELSEDVEFRRTYEEGRKTLEKRKRDFDRKISRPSCLTAERSLLFFPDDLRDKNENELDSRCFSLPSAGRNRFVSLRGYGTVVDPGLSFFDAFYRLGGSLDDLRNIVFSSSRMIEPSWFELLRTLYEKRPPAERIRLVATPDVVRRFDDELCSLEESGIAEAIRFARPSEAELLGGATISMQSGSVVLKTPTGKTIQFADLSGNFRSDSLISGSDALILSGADLFTAIAWAGEKRPGLVVFDSKESRSTADLADAIRRYLRPEIAWAVAAPMLVCDIESRQFLDAVKTLDHPNDSWTDFEKMGSAVGSSIYYFDRESKERFEDEQKEIVDSFEFYRNRRQNLYFA